MKASNSAVLASGALVAGLLSAAANGAVVSQCGPTICYDYDDEQAALELFGTPTLVGDSMRFLPSSFLAAASSEEQAVSIATSTFVFDRVYTVGGQDLANITIRELGDYRIQGGGEVSADLFMLAASNDTPDFVTAQDSVSAPGDSNGLQVWELTAALNDGTLFSDVALSIQNSLGAIRGDDPDAFSWIQKKIVMVDVGAVPLPATAWLLIPGVLWLGRKAVRRQS